MKLTSYTRFSGCGAKLGPGGPVHQYRRLACEEKGQVEDAGAPRGRQHQEIRNTLEAMEAILS